MIKTIVLAVVCLFAGGALATESEVSCPELNGKFQNEVAVIEVHGDGQSYNIKMQAHIFDFDLNVVADGVSRPVPFGGGWPSLPLKALCQDDALILVMSNPSGTATKTMTFKKNPETGKLTYKEVLVETVNDWSLREVN